jgi:peptidoglycan/LPS O-acetylase OafA/YrhL
MMNAVSQRKVQQSVNLWQNVIWSGFALVVLLALGSYVFNWSWTGFKGNTLWDWLQLLVLPLALTGASSWFSSNREWRREWTMIVIGAIGLVAIFAFGGYVWNWSWTGFSGNTLWDWLKLLLLPIVLTAVTLRFSEKLIDQHPS